MQHTFARAENSGQDEISGSPSRRTALLIHLHTEFTRTCFAVVIAGSIVNALRRRESMRLDPRSIASYLPARPLLGPSLSRDLIGAGLSPEIRRASFAAAGQLQVCMDLSFSYARFGYRMPGALEPLINAWQQLANSCLFLEHMIECAFVELDAISLKPGRHSFAPLLKQIGAGEHPCVDDSGIICLPGWAERRSAPRARNIVIPAEIEFNGVPHEVEVCDLSSTGVGFYSDVNVSKCETFVLRIAGRAGIGCKVRWSDGGRTGASFDLPLNEIALDEILSSAVMIANPEAQSLSHDSDAEPHPPRDLVWTARRWQKPIMDHIDKPEVVLNMDTKNERQFQK